MCANRAQSRLIRSETHVGKVRLLASQDDALSLIDLDTRLSTQQSYSELRIPEGFTFDSGVVLSSLDGTGSALLWLDNTRLRAFDTVNSSLAPIATPTGSYVDLLDVGLDSSGVRLGVREDGSAAVLRLSQTGVQEVWSFSTAVRQVAFYLPVPGVDLAHVSQSGTTRFAGMIDSSNTVHVGRLSWSKTLRVRLLLLSGVSLYRADTAV